MSKNKVLILIDQMEAGGAGRVTSTLLRGLIEKGYEVVMVLDNVNCKVFYPIPNCIRQISIGIKNNFLIGLKQLWLMFAVRRILKRERPDVVIAVTFTPFLYAHYATKGLSVPVICYDHTSFGRNMGRYVNWIRYSLYGQADKLVILTKKDERLLGSKFPRKEVVYNPLTYPIVRSPRSRHKNVLCAGRIDSWNVKGFDRMIDMWSRIAPKHPDWTLQFAGGGSQSKFDELKAMVKKAGIDKQVEFLGQIYDMPALYSVTSIFALPSRVEGFPMVLMEAMSQGCVCCAFEMGGSVHEMMSVTSGSVVKDDDIAEFEKQVELLINQYPEYERFRQSGYSDAGRFSSEYFYAQWDKIIQEVIRK